MLHHQHQNTLLRCDQRAEEIIVQKLGAFSMNRSEFCPDATSALVQVHKTEMTLSGDEMVVVNQCWLQ